VTKWLKLGSCSFHHNVVQCLNSLPTKFDDEIRRGAQTRVGWFWTSRCYISEAMGDKSFYDN